MNLNARHQRPSGKCYCRTLMTLLDIVILGFRRAFSWFSNRYTKRQILAAAMAALVVSLALVASYTWWFKSVPISYRWGSYVGCPATYINTGDPTLVSNPQLHMKGGRKTKPFTQIEHFVACDVPIVRDKKERARFIKSGRLIALEGEYIALHGVEEPYVNPLMLLFTTRVSELYYGQKCGVLDITSALRNLARQREEIKNGSLHSAHPYGMGIDLRIPAGERCKVWLRDTLLDIERLGRIDFTQEGSPAHFHVTLIPGAYEQWLMGELGIIPDLTYDATEVHWLTTALFFEGSIKEQEAGLQAIASVIKNRRDGKRFSADTIKGVVAQGARGQKNGGFHFSFMCDGLPEQPWVICEQHPKDTKKLWGASYPCGRRWAEYNRLAIKFMNAPDNTGGADHYYTGKKPWWADKEMPKPMRIGSHIFG